MTEVQKKEYQEIIHTDFSSGAEIQEAYEIIRNDQENNLDFCLRYLLKMSQDGSIHYLVGMKNLTTVENQYILSLNIK